MPTRSRIVAGLDGSAASVAAARFAAAEAAAAGGGLRLVHAQLARSAYALLTGRGLVFDAPVEARRLVEAQAVQLRREHPGLAVRPVVSTRGAGAALVRASRSADLLVIGGTGTGPVAAHVLALAACPVTLVRAAGPGRPAEVVLGLPLSAPNAAAVRHAFEAAERRGATLRVVCPGDGGDDAWARRAVSEALAEWRRLFADVPVAVDVPRGLEAAENAALIVVGEDGLRDALSRDAACPVAVVRAGRAQAGVTSVTPPS